MHVIFGSSSGIGLALAKELHRRNENLLLASHRPSELAQHFPQSTPETVLFDGLDPSSYSQLDALFDPNRIIISIFIVFGTGYINQELDFSLESKTTQLNVQAFTAVASRAMKHLIAQGSGTLVGIGSVATVRGSPAAPAYNASKAFLTRYLEGLRLKAMHASQTIQITEIRPGFVDTAMMKTDKPLWPISPETAAKKILSAVERRKGVAYVPQRWFWVALLLRLLPASVYNKL